MANIDYSQLDDELKERPSDREEKRMKKEFEDKLNKLTIAIESAAPNMKVRGGCPWLDCQISMFLFSAHLFFLCRNKYRPPKRSRTRRQS